MSLTCLTRRHGFKISPSFPCSVEDCSLAVAKVVGAPSVKSAARMNGGVVIFVDEVEKANTVIANGVVVKDTLVSVTPLTTPAKKVLLSNVPPFIEDDLIVKELTRFGKVVSPVKKLLSGCKAPELKHVVSHRRQLYMILTDRSAELNLTFKLMVDGFAYVVFATTGNMKCFSCGMEGHLAKACPGEGSSVGRSDTGRRGRGENPWKQNVDGETDRGEKDRQEAGQTDENGEEREEGEEQEGGAGGGGLNEAEVMTDVQTEADQSTVGANNDMETQEDNSPTNSQEVAGSADAGCEVRAEGGLTAEAGLGEEDNSPGRDKAEEGLAMEVNMGAEEDSLKLVRQKRKARDPTGSQAKKMAEDNENEGLTQGDTEAEVSSEAECEKYESDEATHEEVKDAYTVEEMKQFLQKTKNMKGVKVENYFPNKVLFIESARANMKTRGKGALTEQEIYRLRRIVQKLGKN